VKAFRSRVAASMGALAVLAACGTGSRGEVESSVRPEPASMAEMEALYWARVESARTRFSAEDARFLVGMIDHHSQAVRMANLAPDRAGSQPIRTLAARILASQEEEIEIMRQWLEDRGQAAPGMHGPGMAHGGHGMPGMLGPDEIIALEAASGVAFDRLFLRSMIIHHRGAVAMVDELFSTDGAANAPEIFRIASDIQADQASEVTRMERMLAQLPDGAP